jgi:hypothetical protein
VGFDEVEPRGFSRSEHGTDSKPAEKAQEARMIVDVVQVVQDHEQSLSGVAGAEPSEGFKEIRESLLATKDAAEAIGVDVVEAKELLCPLEPTVGSPSP